MADQPTQEFEALIDGYLDGTLTQAEHAELFRWVESDRVLLRRFAQLTELDAILREHASNQAEAEILSNQMLLPAQDPHGPAAAVSLFQELAEFEADRGDEPHLPTIHLDATVLTKEKYVSALSYVLRHSFTPKRVTMLASAAALLLGLVLVIVMLSGPKPQEQIVDRPGVTGHDATVPQTITNPVVATLTAERDAVWDRRPGEDLLSGQQLNLLEGFAEIKTVQGAIAILEAPTFISLTGGKNALYLHEGKLVGICEVPSSKGFAVQTPEMKVVDLGTRFAVEVNSSGQSSVHVIEGEVAASIPVAAGGDGVEQVLSAGEAGRVSNTRSQIEAIEITPTRFTTLIGNDKQPRVAGAAAVWMDQIPADLRVNKRASNSLLMCLEQSDLILDQDIPVDFKPGQSFNPAVHHFAFKPTSKIAAGQRVSVYLVHFDPAPMMLNQQFTIHFDRPILGVIALDNALNRTDEIVGVPGIMYPSTQDVEHKSLRGLDPNSEYRDWLTCHDASLDLKLSGLGFLDQIRVIVQEP